MAAPGSQYWEDARRGRARRRRRRSGSGDDDGGAMETCGKEVVGVGTVYSSWGEGDPGSVSGIPNAEEWI
jgi:hypothetical protein